MKLIVKILALAGLLLTLLPSLFFWNDMIDKNQLTTYMFLGTIIWFIFGSMWLGKKNTNAEENL